MNDPVDRLALLELDLDARLAELWVLATEVLPAEWYDVAGRLMRAAYGQGYTEAALGDRTVFTEHGYMVPR